MTEEKDQEQQPKEPFTPKKKWLLISLCSVMLLGGVGGYAVYNQQSNDQTASVEQSNTKVPKKKKALSPWEKQVQPKKKKEEKKEKTKESTDSILGMIIGDNQGKHLFGSDEQTGKQKKNLLEKLAEAFDTQDKKESERNKDRLLVAADSEKESTKGLLLSTDLGKNQPKKENNDFENKKDEDSTNKEEKPIVDPTPNNPDVPVNPNNPVVPDNPDKPVDPVVPDDPDTPVNPDPSVDQLIQQSKDNLEKSTSEVVKVNKKLHDIKSELNNLKNIDENTQTIADKADSQWKQVQALVAEYNQLSSELKQLLDENGAIPAINTELYTQTYEALTQKVDEVKQAQTDAKKMTDIMNQNINKAQNTADHLEEKQSDYSQIKQEAETATSNVEQATTKAKENSAVQEAVQPQIDQAADKTASMNQTNQATNEVMNQVVEKDNQSAIDSAQQTATSTNDQADSANQAVTDVTDDYASLPQPPLAPTTPSENEPSVPIEQDVQAPVDSSNQLPTTQVSTVNDATSSQTDTPTTSTTTDVVL